MNLSRREFTQLLACAGIAGVIPGCLATSRSEQDFYKVKNFGDVRLLHITDTHAQLNPIYYREPNINLGFHSAKGSPPHLVGQHLLNEFSITAHSQMAHALTYLDFQNAAKLYGKVGGFAYIKTLVDQLRGNFGQDKTLLLDGGDTWQGSGTAYWTKGKDMLGASNLLGVDIMTGHWEFTYQDQQIMQNIKEFNGEFLAQNIKVTEEALFNDAPAFDTDSGHAFKPYTIKTLNGHRIAIIGQAFPYTPIANPKRFIPDWTFGIQEQELQNLVEQIKSNDKPAAIVLLSHNGMDVDLKLASRVSGIDIVLGGHTHDGVPKAIEVSNKAGITIVTNAGSNGKFVGVMDLAFTNGKFSGYQYTLLPVFSNLLTANKKMQHYIDEVRLPFKQVLEEPLGVAGSLLYRRGNFNGTFDQLICDSLRNVNDSQIALSPGFRWGTSLLAGQTITMDHLLDQTCITYPETYTRNLTGAQIKAILEDVADNLFNKDPYFQQGGDMVRVGGLDYRLNPLASTGNRVSEMHLDNGTKIMPGKSYKVAGWATVNSQSTGKPIWDIVSEYIKSKGVVNFDKINTPKLSNVKGNSGYA